MSDFFTNPTVHIPHSTTEISSPPQKVLLHRREFFSTAEGSSPPPKVHNP
ncbi:hypothetical protein Lalb_Chr02g0151941 [Lupinus albus]|uniref:Uncharacterized protein n=1 Tax=Lupinus albus TaxID=3870 RepID=A0A6A4R099_LUPAL|nr:hypothetical protein Lalb_Chr02g0151941 [Lupinus albus]